MANQPEQTPQRMLPFLPVLLAGLAASAVVVGIFSGQYIERNRHTTPQIELQNALQALRTGYDQTALSLLKPLADEGNPKAQYWLADIYQNGYGVTPNPSKAVALLEKSATQGFVPAEGRLGELYLQGDETLQDFGKAQTWLHKAAVAGDGSAQRELGQIFALGLGVTRDLAQAYAWYENASLSGDGLGKHMRDDILTRMSPTEISAGEQDAKIIKADIKPAGP
jgi:TPR repeat protein